MEIGGGGGVGEESAEECVVCRGVEEGEGVAQHVKL